MAIVSLVLGIVGIALPAFLASKSVIWAILGLVLCIVGIVLGIVGVILAAIGRKKSPQGHQGMATAGVVCSILAIVIGVIWWYRLANAVNEGVGGLSDFAKQLQQEMQKEMQNGNAE